MPSLAAASVRATTIMVRRAFAGLAAEASAYVLVASSKIAAPLKGRVLAMAITALTILANAVIQWIPDHEALLPALIARLAPGGALAVQTPDNLDEPSHRLMREVAAAGPWAKKLAEAAEARAVRQGADWYFRLLRRHAQRVEIWRTTYFHPLAGAPSIVEWVKGTGLRPFLDPLDAGEREAYLARYGAAITEAYPAEPDGTVLLPFPRLFFVAVR